MTTSPFAGTVVRLRPFEPDDAAALCSYVNEPGLTGRRYLPHRFPDEVPLVLAQAEAVIAKWSEEKKGMPLAVVVPEADGDIVVGHASAEWHWDPHCPSVSVAISPRQWRRGYGSDALRVVLRYLFGRTVAHNVSCWYGDWNSPAAAFAARHGFTVTGGMRRAGVRDGLFFDEVSADLLRPEWLAMREGRDAS